MSLIPEFTTRHDAVKEGMIFIAIKGISFDGHLKIDEVLQKNPLFIFSEKEHLDPRVIKVENTRLTYALLCAGKFDFPSKKMKVFGVTGTSGKTTTTTLLESILKEEGHRVGLIGTIENRIDGKKIQSTHTTPDSFELQSLLHEMVEKKCTALIMEVSSHALSQKRVSGVFFDQLGFLNLTPEHLDYHSSMEEYFEAKKLFFTEEWDRSAILGTKKVQATLVQSEYGKKLFHSLDSEKQKNTVCISLPDDLDFKNGFLKGTFSGITLKSDLIGKYNAENISVAVQMAKNAGISDLAIKKGIENCKIVPGRLEKVKDLKGGRVILVDYAHKPDALRNVLETLKPLVEINSKLFCVLGCGGDRDKQKRPVMASIAEQYCDQIFLTSDNPRTENPDQILLDMEKGIKIPEKFKKEPDRKKAIQLALKASQKGDWILIAGKGHETYQIIGKESFPFDDRIVAQEFLDS